MNYLCCFFFQSSADALSCKGQASFNLLLCFGSSQSQILDSVFHSVHAKYNLHLLNLYVFCYYRKQGRPRGTEPVLKTARDLSQPFFQVFHGVLLESQESKLSFKSIVPSAHGCHGFRRRNCLVSTVASINTTQDSCWPFFLVSNWRTWLEQCIALSEFLLWWV